MRRWIQGFCGHCVLLTLLSGALATSTAVQAAPITYSGTFDITSFISSPGEIAPGDTFDFLLTYDDAAADTSASATSGSFPTAITSFSMSADASNTGTWDPAGGVFTVPASIATAAGSDDVQMQISGSGLPDYDGLPFNLVYFEFLDASFDIVDSGTGDTLGTQLGGPFPTDLSLFDEINVRLFFEGVDGDGFPVVESPSGTLLQMSQVNSSTVPEPSCLLLLGLGACCLPCCRSRRCSGGREHQD